MIEIWKFQQEWLSEEQVATGRVSVLNNDRRVPIMADWKAGLVAPLFHPTKIWNLHQKTGDRNGPLAKPYGEDT